MKKSRMFIAGIMALCLVGGTGVITRNIAPAVSMTASAEDVVYKNLTYITLEDGTIEIKKCDKSATEVNIPAEIGGVAVTSIGNDAFYGCSNLASVTIPDSITNIGNSAFWGCSSLVSVTIPDSVTNIGNRAFNGCKHLSTVKLGSGITAINDYTFQSCESLVSITIPGNVKNIGMSAFTNCTSLANLEILEGVAEISSAAFNCCSALKSVSIPKSVTSIGVETFSECTSLANLTLAEGLTRIGQSAFRESGLVSLTVPGSVTDIGKNAFEKCTALKEITLSEGLVKIGDSAFYNCEVLKSVDIPESVVNVGYCAFYECKALESITFLNPETIINNSSSTICHTEDYDFDGTIKGYADSTAQAYAEKYERNFVSLGEAPETTSGNNIKTGDANGDGKISLADAVLIMQAISNPDEYKLTKEQQSAADVVDKGDGLTPMDALAIQMVDLELISADDLPITSKELNSALDKN